MKKKGAGCWRGASSAGSQSCRCRYHCAAPWQPRLVNSVFLPRTDAPSAVNGVLCCAGRGRAPPATTGRQSVDAARWAVPHPVRLDGRSPGHCIPADLLRRCLRHLLRAPYGVLTMRSPLARHRGRLARRGPRADWRIIAVANLKSKTARSCLAVGLTGRRTRCDRCTPADQRPGPAFVSRGPARTRLVDQIPSPSCPTGPDLRRLGNLLKRTNTEL